MGKNCANISSKEFKEFEKRIGNIAIAKIVWRKLEGDIDKLNKIRDIKDAASIIASKKSSTETKISTSLPLSKFTLKEVNDITQNLMFLLFWDNKRNTVKDIEDVKLDDLPKLIEEHKNLIPDTRGKNRILRNNHDEILKEENLEVLKEKIKNEIKKLSITIDEEANPDDKNSGFEYSDSELIRPRDKARVSTKLLIAFTPKSSSSTVLGIKTFKGFNSTWTNIENKLAGVPYVEGEDRFDTFVGLLEEESKIIPEYSTILDVLRNSSEKVKTQFVRSFDNRKVNYQTELINKTEDSKGTDINYKSSNNNTAEKRLRTRWNEDFINNFLAIDKDGIPHIDTNKAKESIKEYNNILRKISRLVGQGRKIVSKELYADIVNFLNGIGINANEGVYAFIKNESKNDLLNASELLSPNALGYIVTGSRYSKNSLQQLAEGKLESDGESTISPILSESKLKRLSFYQEKFEDNIHSNTVYAADGEMYQTISQWDYLSASVEDIKNGTYFQGIGYAFTKNSKYIEYLKDEKNRKKLEIFLGLDRKVNNEASSNKEINSIDRLISRIENTFRDKIPYLTPGDKNKDIYFKGLPKFKTIDERTDALIGYLKDELIAMKQAHKDINNPSLQNKLVKGYHLNEDGSLGTAFELFTFPELNPGTELANELGLYMKSRNNEPFTITDDFITEDSEGNVTVNPSFDTKIKESGILKKVFEKRLEENYKKLKDLVVYDHSKKELVFNPFSKEISKHYFKSNNLSYKDVTAALKAIAFDYSMDTSIANIEFGKLFTGDPRFYGSIKGYGKRVQASIATKERLRITKGVREFFDIAITKDDEVPSNYFSDKKEMKALRDKLKEGVTDKAKKDWIDEQLDNSIKATSKIDRTDGQAWVTMERFKEIMIGLGEWDNEKMDKAYDRIVANNGTATSEDYLLFTQKSMNFQPKKGVHFELTHIGNVVAPVYLKYSIAVLFPGLINSSKHLTKVHKAMVEQGVSELVSESAIKSGAIAFTDLEADNIKFNKLTLRNKHWGLQQDLPMKDKNIAMGTQPQKNMLADVELDKEYSDGRIGKELVRHIHNITSNLSERGLHKVKQKLGVDDEGNLSRKDLNNFLIEELKRDGDVYGVIKALQKGIDIDALPSHRQTLWSKIAHFFTKNTVKFKQGGGSAIQMSDYGFDTKRNFDSINNLSNKQKDGIVWLKNNTELLPPRLENREFKEGEILLPYERVAKLFGKEWDKIKTLPPEEILKRIDPEVLALIGYRIPNQKMSSNQNLKVVGILPPHAGNTVIGFPEIITFTGSDFDIDKMFFLRKHITYNKDTNRIETVKFLTNDNSTPLERAKEIIRNSSDLHYTLSKLYKGNISDIINQHKSNIDHLNSLYKKINSNKKILSETTEEEKTIIDEIKELNKSKKNRTRKEKDNINLEIFEKQAHLVNLMSDEKRNAEQSNYTLYNEIKESRQIIDNFAEQLAKNLDILPIEQQNTRRAVDNERVEGYRTILGDKHTYVKMISPIDGGGLKDQINYMLPDKPNEGLALFDGFNQLQVKEDNDISKAGVGQVANQQSDNAISQLGEKKMSDPENRLSEDGILDLSRPYSKPYDEIQFKKENGKIVKKGTKNKIRLITNIISEYVNAFVDAAKDNYIAKANYTYLTNNTAFLMLRSGIDPQLVTAFMSQPIIKRYYELSELKSAKSTFAYGKSIIDILKDEFKLQKGEAIPKLSISDLDKNDLMNIVKDATNNPDTYKEDLDNLMQHAILDLFLYGKELSNYLRDSVMISKTDVNGNDGSLMEAYVVRNKRINITEKRHSTGEKVFDKFEKMFDGTMLGEYTKNSVDKYIDIIGSKSLVGTKAIQATLNEVYKDIFGKYPDSSDLLKPMYNILYAETVYKKSKLADYDIRKLVKGEHSLARRILDVRQRISNELLDSLQINIGMYGNLDYVGFDNTKEVDKFDRERLHDAWLRLFNTPMYKNLAVDLAVYSLHTSLYSGGIKSFYRMLPHQIVEHLEIPEAIEKAKIGLNGENAETIYHHFKSTIMENVWDNKRLVPKLNGKKVDIINGITKFKGFKANIKKNSFLIVGKDNEGNLVYKPYVTIDHTMGTTMGGTYKKKSLYKYVGNDEEGNGVYKVVDKKGDRYKGYKFYEFSKKSILEDKNSVPLSYKEENLIMNNVETIPGSVELNGEVNIMEYLDHESTMEDNTNNNASDSIFDIPTITELKLKDGKTYNVTDINVDMLEQMGHTEEEIKDIIKKICG